jgi:hypothetical protein
MLNGGAQCPRTEHWEGQVLDAQDAAGARMPGRAFFGAVYLDLAGTTSPGNSIYRISSGMYHIFVTYMYI